MKLLRVVVPGLEKGRLQLDKQASRYVCRVHRLTSGDVFVAIDPERGVRADAVIASVTRGGVTCDVGEVVQVHQLYREPIWLLLGLCAQDKFCWAIREATALGVTHIVPVIMERSASALASGAASKPVRQALSDGTIPSHPDSPDPNHKRAARWRKILTEGARQSLREDVPYLHEILTLSQSFEALPSTVLPLCLSQFASMSAGQLMRSAREKQQGIALIIGPEGGFESDELEQMSKLGIAFASLGPWVLRTETAVIAALGAWAASEPGAANTGC